MSVVIRMKRTGRRNRPCYRISVSDSRSPRDGRTLDNLGLYDPIAPKAEDQVRLDVERARAWLDRGVQLSDTVRSIFRREGVLEGRPEKQPRSRPGRKAETKKRARRSAAKAERAERKEGRRNERLAAKKAAAAAAAEGDSSEE